MKKVLHIERLENGYVLTIDGRREVHVDINSILERIKIHFKADLDKGLEKVYDDVCIGIEIDFNIPKKATRKPIRDELKDLFTNYGETEFDSQIADWKNAWKGRGHLGTELVKKSEPKITVDGNGIPIKAADVKAAQSKYDMSDQARDLKLYGSELIDTNPGGPPL